MKDIELKLIPLLAKDDIEERCGLILKSGEVLECDNAHLEPTKGFKILPEVMLENLEEMVGTWHTHPGQDSNLSQEDYLGFTQWPTLTHYIIGIDGVCSFVVENGLIKEIKL